MFPAGEDGVGQGEREALTFNDSLCNSTLEVIITNTMQAVTFDPHPFCPT